MFTHYHSKTTTGEICIVIALDRQSVCRSLTINFFQKVFLGESKRILHVVNAPCLHAHTPKRIFHVVDAPCLHAHTPMQANTSRNLRTVFRRPHSHGREADLNYIIKLNSFPLRFNVTKYFWYIYRKIMVVFVICNVMYP